MTWQSRRRRLAVLALCAGSVASCRWLPDFGERLPRARVFGRITDAAGRPRAGAWVSVRFGFVSPGGEAPRGECLPPVVGGDAVRADANGRYTVTSTARVSDPMEVCVQVQAWPAPMVSTPSVTVQAQRMAVSFEAVPEQRVDVTLADVP